MAEGKEVDEVITDLRIKESENFADIFIEAQCEGISWWKVKTGAVKVRKTFEKNSFEVTIEVKSRVYGLKYNGQQLFKPIVSKKCEAKIGDDSIKVILRKEQAETWREGGSGPIRVLLEDA
ncbi:uncharacterized protein LOC144434621 [Glandiceps talaboti]